ERGALGMLPDDWPTATGRPLGAGPVALTVGFGAGVTDTVGATVKRAAEDRLGRRLDGAAYSSTMYLVWGLPTEAVERAARELLYNPLIQRARIETMPRVLDLTVPRA